MSDAGTLGLSLRAPPAYPEAEYALLGALLTNNRSIEAVAEFLEPRHFADSIHGTIYRVIRDFWSVGRAVTPLTIWPVLESMAALKPLGGNAYLAKLASHMISPRNSREYGEVIREAWARRELISIGEDIVNAAFMGGEQTAADIVALLDARMIEIAQADRNAARAKSLDEAIDAALAAAEEAARRGGPVGLSTGMRGIDDVLGGLEAGTLTVIAGRPGMGKSALCHQWAVAAARAGVGVIEISLEMSATQLGRRTLATAARVPLGRLQRGQHGAFAERLVEARKQLRGLALTIEDGAGLTASQIAAKVREARRRHGVGLIMVDHLHIINTEQKDDKLGATVAIGRVSGAMKRLAKDFNAPVLLAAQLNRAVDGRDDKRPTLADLRQSGEIEQNADAVGFVYRGEYYLGQRPEKKAEETQQRYDQRCLDWDAARDRLHGTAEVIFAKVRDGAPQSVQLRWDGETTTFWEPTSP